MLYFFNARGSRISIITFPCVTWHTTHDTWHMAHSRVLPINWFLQIQNNLLTKCLQCHPLHWSLIPLVPPFNWSRFQLVSHSTGPPCNWSSPFIWSPHSIGRTNLVPNSTGLPFNWSSHSTGLPIQLVPPFNWFLIQTAPNSGGLPINWSSHSTGPPIQLVSYSIGPQFNWPPNQLVPNSTGLPFNWSPMHLVSQSSGPPIQLVPNSNVFHSTGPTIQLVPKFRTNCRSVLGSSGHHFFF